MSTPKPDRFSTAETHPGEQAPGLPRLVSVRRRLPSRSPQKCGPAASGWRPTRRCARCGTKGTCRSNDPSAACLTRRLRHWAGRFTSDSRRSSSAKEAMRKPIPQAEKLKVCLKVENIIFNGDRVASTPNGP